MDSVTLRSRLFSGSSSAAILRAVTGYARSSAFGVLRQGLIHGELTIEDAHGVYTFGELEKGYEVVRLKVLNDNMWGQIFMSHDLGLAEAYMQGHFEVSTLKGLLNLWLDNRDGLGGLATTISSLFACYTAWAIRSLFRQNLKMAKWSANVSYDVSNIFMQAFLSKEMMYSAALWGEEEHGPRGDLTVGHTEGDLESAQQRKIQYVLRKARLRPGDRLLEIGSGWGAMAIEAGRLGCTVDTITLSHEQKAIADERIAAGGLSERVRVHLCDYRELPSAFEHQFDACISIEMIELVGPKNYGDYFRAIDWALKRGSGAVVISSTTRPEHRYTDYQAEDFVRRYHWPNTHAPSATSLAVAVQTAVPGKLVLHSVEDHGIHYSRTLREWGRRFEKNFQGSVVESMQDQYPFLRDSQNLEMFKKKWMYMFVYAEVGFSRAYTSIHYLTFARPENVSEPCA